MKTKEWNLLNITYVIGYPFALILKSFYFILFLLCTILLVPFAIPVSIALGGKKGLQEIIEIFKEFVKFLCVAYLNTFKEV